MSPFLTADYKNLILLTYAAGREALLPYLPKGLELDSYKGRAFVSFMAFECSNMRVIGFPIPFHRNFPEVSLRFYVRHRAADGERRGVVFIKKMTPKRMISLMASRMCGKSYETAPLRFNKQATPEHTTLDYRLQYGGQRHDWTFKVQNRPYLPGPGSTEHFFKEHEWGLGTNHKGRLTRYRITHPRWRIFPIPERFGLNVDFGLMYGEHWRFLNNLIPYNIMVAEGSTVQVFRGEVIE